jgi:catalase
VARHKPNHPNCDFTQPGNLFRKVFNDEMREHTVDTIVKTMKNIPRDVAEKAIKNFYKADSEMGTQIAKLLGYSAIKSRL